MPRRIHRQRMALLDEMGEEEVFRAYLEQGSVNKLTRHIFDPAPGYEDAELIGVPTFYSWLKDEPGRWGRWQNVRMLRGHAEADLVLEEAMKATPKNSSAQRVKVDALKWRAGVLNRDTYGQQPTTQVNVGVQVGMAWLEGLRDSEQVTESPQKHVEGPRSDEDASEDSVPARRLTEGERADTGEGE